MFLDSTDEEGRPNGLVQKKLVEFKVGVLCRYRGLGE